MSPGSANQSTSGASPSRPGTRPAAPQRIGRSALRSRDLLWLGSIGVLLVVTVLYPLTADAYHVSIVRDALLFGLFALSLDFLWGKTEVLSFGHAAFFGLGAYGMAIVTVNSGLASSLASPAGLVAGVLLASIIALGLGYLLIFGGVRGSYFAIVTFAVTLIANQVAIGWSAVTGGDTGLIGVPPLTVGGYVISNLRFYYLVIALSAVILLAMWWLCRGRYGRILAAIQDNEIRAKSLGYNTASHILIVFVLSAALAGFAGALYVSSTGFVTPDLTGLLLSTEVILWVAAGGRGTLLGAFIGTFVVMRLQQVVSSANATIWPIFMGAFFIALVFLFPDGLLSLFRGFGRTLQRRSAGETNVTRPE